MKFHRVHMKINRGYHMKFHRGYHMKFHRGYHMKFHRGYHMKFHWGYHMEFHRGYHMKINRGDHMKIFGWIISFGISMEIHMGKHDSRCQNVRGVSVANKFFLRPKISGGYL